MKEIYGFLNWNEWEYMIHVSCEYGVEMFLMTKRHLGEDIGLKTQDKSVPDFILLLLLLLMLLHNAVVSKNYCKKVKQMNRHKSLFNKQKEGVCCMKLRSVCDQIWLIATKWNPHEGRQKAWEKLVRTNNDSCFLFVCLSKSRLLHISYRIVSYHMILCGIATFCVIRSHRSSVADRSV